MISKNGRSRTLHYSLFRRTQELLVFKVLSPVYHFCICAAAKPVVHRSPEDFYITCQSVETRVEAGVVSPCYTTLCQDLGSHCVPLI